MKSAILIVICLAIVLAAAPVAAQEPVPAQTEPFPLYRSTLSNNLHLWIQPRDGSESVAVLLILHAGSRYEDTANNGVSHFVEHVLFTGTERWTEQEIKEVITERGGYWNGWTNQENTAYWAQVAASDLDIALDWLDQIVFHPTFPADKIDKERQVIFQEKWGRYGWIINTLDALGFGYELDRNVYRAIFPGSSLGLRVVGEDASLDSVDRQALLDYYHSYYTPDNATLLVVGGVTAQQVQDSASRIFGNLPTGSRPPAPETPPLPSSGPQQVTVRGPWPTDQVSLMLGTRTVGRLDPDRWALQVLAEMLSRDLTADIRYQQGLVYGLGAYNYFFEDTGYLAIETTSSRRAYPLIQRTAEEALARVGQGQVEAASVTQAQAAIKGRWALAMEDNLTRARWLADWASVLPDGEPVPDLTAAIDAVTPQDLVRVVSTYYVPERRFVGLHLPVVTVASGAWFLAGIVVLAVGLWALRRLRRRARVRRYQEATPV
jgi:predicted Zn-dependent peptidase